MGVYLDPRRLSNLQCRLIDEWLVANGSRRLAAREAVLIRGRFVEFVELTDFVRIRDSSRQRSFVDHRFSGHGCGTHRRVLRVRVPFPTREIFGER